MSATQLEIFLQAVCYFSFSSGQGTLQEKLNQVWPNKPKEKHNRWEYRGIKQKCWEISSFHLCSSILAHQGSLSPCWEREAGGDHGRETQHGLVAVPRGDPPPPGLEVVFGLLRTGKQFSDKEHHFSSWGEPKCRGVSSEPYPVSPESRCPLANPCLLLQLGYSHSQASQEFQIFRRCPSWVLEVFFSSDPIKHHPPQIGSWPLLGGPKWHRPRQLLAVSSLVPHLLSCFKCFAADPKRNRPKSQLPQKQSLESRAG